MGSGFRAFNRSSGDCLKANCQSPRRPRLIPTVMFCEALSYEHPMPLDFKRVRQSGDSTCYAGIYEHHLGEGGENSNSIMHSIILL
ncbi:hypothetical protein TNCV_1716501 [Trichonephila clavipes]|nr:hypothetical protein TNCV_1716501 [Trichonephila clavipes]